MGRSMFIQTMTIKVQVTNMRPWKYLNINQLPIIKLRNVTEQSRFLASLRNLVQSGCPDSLVPCSNNYHDLSCYSLLGGICSRVPRCYYIICLSYVYHLPGSDRHLSFSSWYVIKITPLAFNLLNNYLLFKPHSQNFPSISFSQSLQLELISFQISH